MIWLALFLCILAINLAYGARKIFDDLSARKFSMVAIGVLCLLGMNFIIGFMVYHSIASSTDL